MAIDDWIVRRMELCGWASWRYLRIAAGISVCAHERFEAERELTALTYQQVSRLARALGTTAKMMWAIDCGDAVDAPLPKDARASANQWQDAIDNGDIADSEWPPKPKPQTPTVGESNWRGDVEIGDGEPVPEVYGDKGRHFAIKIYPGVRSSVYRLMSSDWWREGMEIAVWEAGEWDGDGHGYVGRTEGHDQVSVYLRLANNEIVPVKRMRVVRIAKEIATYPPPLGGGSSIADPHATKETPKQPRSGKHFWWDEKFMPMRGAGSKPTVIEGNETLELDADGDDWGGLFDGKGGGE